MYAGYVSLASHWLRTEAAAVAALASDQGAMEEPAFYTAKRQTSAFVFERLLPRTRQHKAVMLAPPSTLLSLKAEHFSFDHALG